MVRTILVLTATPRDATPLNLGKEVREIQDAIKRSRYRDRYQIVLCPAAQPSDLHRMLREHRPSIVHFAGHGRGEEGLVFEDADGATLTVDADQLANTIGSFAYRHRIECVVFSACHSHVLLDRIAEHVPYAIGMKSAVDQRASVAFARSFYEALGNRVSVPDACKVACQDVRMLGLSVQSIADCASGMLSEQTGPWDVSVVDGRGQGPRPWAGDLAALWSGAKNQYTWLKCGLAIGGLGLTLTALAPELGLADLEARLRLIGLPEDEIAQASGNHDGHDNAGWVVLGRLILFAVVGLSTGVDWERWGILLAIAVASVILVLAHHRHWRSAILILGMLVPVSALGVICYVHAVDVHHVVLDPVGVQSCRVGDSLPEQIRFEVCSWLANSASHNAGRRQALGGLWLWLSWSLATMAWVGARAAIQVHRTRLRVGPVWPTIAAVVTLLYVGFFGAVVKQAASAHAIAHWGVSYPQVMAIEPDCAAPLSIEIDSAGRPSADECVIYELGDQPGHELLLIHRTCMTNPASSSRWKRALRSMDEGQERCVRRLGRIQSILNRG